MSAKKLSGLLSVGAIVASSLALPSWTPKVLACSCIDFSPNVKRQNAEAVFTGRVIASKDLKAGAKIRSGIDPIAWTFAVEHVFKGNVAKQQQVNSAAMDMSCGFPFKVGDRYQVYARREGNTLTTRLCSGTKPLAVNISDLLRDPPLPRTRVEIDGYYAGQTTIPMRGEFLYRVPKNQVFCPYKTRHRFLTNQPLLGTLSIAIGYSTSNELSDSVPWLIATLPQARQLGVDIDANLPYHARVRGYLGEPKFAACPNANRIFVVEKVLKVYAALPDPKFFPASFPKDYTTWPSFHDPKLGYRVSYPSGWKVEVLPNKRNQLSAIALRSQAFLNYPMTVRVYSAPSVAVRNYFAKGPYRQWLPPDNRDTQNLGGIAFDKKMGNERTMSSVSFSGGDRIYELKFVYPTGIEASQELLNAFIFMVQRFRLDNPPENVQKG
jgi:hypothetical protein